MLSGIHFDIEDIIKVLTIIGSIIVFLKYLDGKREKADDVRKGDADKIANDIKDNQALIQAAITKSHEETRDEINSIKSEVTIIQHDARQFKPRQELDMDAQKMRYDIDHVKAGYQQSDIAVVRLTEKNGDAIRKLEIEMAGMKADHNNTSKEVTEIKKIIADQADRTEKLLKEAREQTKEDMNEIKGCINELMRRAGDGQLRLPPPSH